MSVGKTGFSVDKDSNFDLHCLPICSGRLSRAGTNRVRHCGLETLSADHHDVHRHHHWHRLCRLRQLRRQNWSFRKIKSFDWCRSLATPWLVLAKLLTQSKQLVQMNTFIFCFVFALAFVRWVCTKYCCLLSWGRSNQPGPYLTFVPSKVAAACESNRRSVIRRICTLANF